MRDESLLSDLIQVPFSDAAVEGVRQYVVPTRRETASSPLNREVELRTSTELRGHPKFSSHQLHQPFRDYEEQVFSLYIARRQRTEDSLVRPRPVPPYFLVVDPSA